MAEELWSLLKVDVELSLVPELSFDDICPASHLEQSGRGLEVIVFNIGVQPVSYPLPPPSRYVPKARPRGFATASEQACLTE